MEHCQPVWLSHLHPVHSINTLVYYTHQFFLLIGSNIFVLNMWNSTNHHLRLAILCYNFGHMGGLYTIMVTLVIDKYAETFLYLEKY